MPDYEDPYVLEFFGHHNGDYFVVIKDTRVEYDEGSANDDKSVVFSGRILNSQLSPLQQMVQEANYWRETQDNKITEEVWS